MIAMALACTPQVLIADEPTTALDVTIQAQIVDLVKRLRQELGMAIIWITHDLGIVAGMANRVMVMYAGFIVERSPVHELYSQPPAPLHARSARLAAAHRRRRRHPADEHQGPAPGYAAPAQGLPVRGALPIRLRAVR